MCYKTYSYLRTVFFMVLDFKVSNEDWVVVMTTFFCFITVPVLNCIQREEFYRPFFHIVYSPDNSDFLFFFHLFQD